ncbi:MAG: hypothetical protein WBP56_16865 [Polyangia bacterium]|jgi:hypothetical protein
MASSKSPLHRGPSWPFTILLLGLAASCKSNSTADKVDAGQRKYCNGTPVDGGFDTAGKDGGTADVLANSADLGSGSEAGTRDSLAVVVDGPAVDLRGVSGEVGVVDSGGGLDLTSSDAPNGANDAGGTGGGGGGGGSIGNGDARGFDGTSESRGDGGIGASADRGPPDLLADVQADAHADAQTGVYSDAQADAPAAPDATVLVDVVAADGSKDISAVVDLAPDAPAGTCSINGATWAKAWDSHATLVGLAVSPDGTRWANGNLYGAVDFGTGTPLPHASDTSSDVFLVKLDPSSGLATQAFSFNDSAGNDQIATNLAVAQSGDVVVVGSYRGEIDFTAAGSDTGSDGLDYLSRSSVVAGAEMSFYVVAAAASSGQYITPVKAHNVDVGTGTLLAAASNPNVDAFAICGKTSRLLAASTAATGLLTVTGATYGGSMDIVVAKINASDGSIIWGDQFGGTGDQVCESLTMDSSGNVIMGGTYNGALDFGNGHTLPTVATSGLSLPFVAILNGSGVVTAAATWGTSGISDIYGIAVDINSNVIIGGAIGANIDFGGSPDIAITDRGKTDGFVAKLNSSLVPQWAFSFGDASYDQAVNTVAVSSTGDVFIGGAFEGTLNGLNGLVDSSNSNDDAFTAHLSGADGSVLCAQSYGDAAGTQLVTSVTVASAATGALADSVMIGGSFQNTITLGSTTLLSPGTFACSVDADCQQQVAGSSCSHGYCVNGSAIRSFISRLSASP